MPANGHRSPRSFFRIPAVRRVLGALGIGTVIVTSPSTVPLAMRSMVNASEDDTMKFKKLDEQNQTGTVEVEGWRPSFDPRRAWSPETTNQLTSDARLSASISVTASEVPAPVSPTFGVLDFWLTTSVAPAAMPVPDRVLDLQVAIDDVIQPHLADSHQATGRSHWEELGIWNEVDAETIQCDPGSVKGQRFRLTAVLKDGPKADVLKGTLTGCKPTDFEVNRLALQNLAGSNDGYAGFPAGPYL